MLNNKAYRFLFLLPTAIMIVFSLFFSNVSEEIEQNLLNEKFEEKKLAVATMANHANAFIAQYDSRGDIWLDVRSYYQQSLLFDIAILDSAYLTYAVIFDDQLTPLSVQHKYNGGFDPTIYPSFKSEIYDHEMGDMIILFKPNAGTERDVYVHYRWIPTCLVGGDVHTDRFLVVVAISKYTVLTQTADWYQLGSIVLIAITTLLNIAMVLIICRLAERAEWKCAH